LEELKKPWQIARIRQSITWISKIMPKMKFTLTSICDIFYDEESEFIIILVFLPV
jgi:hypothetical protein